MLKNILGSLVFTVAVFVVVNFIGDAMVNPATAPHQSNLKVADAEPAPAPEPPQEAASSTPTSTPEAASPEAVTSEAVTPEVAAPVVAPATAQATAMAGDVDTGSKTFRKKCMGCHTADKGGANRTGPNLWGIVGKAKGASKGYRYSKNMSALGGVWTTEEISAFIAGPRTFLPDTKMTFPGLKSEQDRADVLAYLKTLKD